MAKAHTQAKYICMLCVSNTPLIIALKGWYVLIDNQNIPDEFEKRASSHSLQTKKSDII